MYYQGQKINGDNYKDIFADCSPDVLDEIRLAIADDTPVLDYVEQCGDDSYTLGQIRLAIREGIPSSYILSGLEGKFIHSLRWCFAHQIDMSGLLPYYNKISVEKVGKLIEMMRLGGNINSVNFTMILDEIMDAVIGGVVKGYPMDICEGCNWLSEDYVLTLIKGMKVEVDVTVFIATRWDIDVMNYLFTNADKVDLNDFLVYISNRFNLDQIQLLLNAYVHKCDIATLTKKYKGGDPIYNEYQMEVLVEAVKLGIAPTNAMFNPSLSDREMEKLLNKHKKLKGIS